MQQIAEEAVYDWMNGYLYGLTGTDYGDVLRAGWDSAHVVSTQVTGGFDLTGFLGTSYTQYQYRWNLGRLPSDFNKDLKGILQWSTIFLDYNLMI